MRKRRNKRVPTRAAHGGTSYGKTVCHAPVYRKIPGFEKECPAQKTQGLFHGKCILSSQKSGVFLQTTVPLIHRKTSCGRNENASAGGLLFFRSERGCPLSAKMRKRAVFSPKREGFWQKTAHGAGGNTGKHGKIRTKRISCAYSPRMPRRKYAATFAMCSRNSTVSASDPSFHALSVWRKVSKSRSP